MAVKLLTYLLLSFLLVNLGQSQVNLLPKFFDQLRPAAQDPDEAVSIAELVKSRGFQLETHSIQTKDEYLLTVHRIANPCNDSHSRPVILQHGLLSSSIDYLINSPGGSLGEKSEQIGNNIGFELSKKCFDVWLPNSRGNTYSRSHLKLNSEKDKVFWDFSFDQLIQFDLPDTIDYILNMTGKTEVSYIGHSQGNLIMFGLLSSQPKYNDIVKPFIALSPVAFVGNIKSPIRHLNFLKSFAGFVSDGPSRSPSQEQRSRKARRCSIPAVRPLCLNQLFQVFGYNRKSLNATRLPVYLHNIPSGSSWKNLKHFAQSISCKCFKKYDFGDEKLNYLKYGNRKAPDYDLSRISNEHIVLFHSNNDWLNTQKDVDMLKSKLKVKLLGDIILEDPEWNHIDYIWSMNAGKLINTRVLGILEKYV